MADILPNLWGYDWSKHKIRRGGEDGFGGGEKEMVIERIARYQRERDAVFEKWENGTIDENVARVAATTITVWIKKLAWLTEEL